MKHNAKNYMSVTKELADAKENLRKVRDAHTKAEEQEKVAGRIPKEHRNAEQQTKFLLAEKWTIKMKKILDTAELQVRTLEIQLSSITKSAKGCVSLSGKPIRV